MMFYIIVFLMGLLTGWLLASLYELLRVRKIGVNLKEANKECTQYFNYEDN